MTRRRFEEFLKNLIIELNKRRIPYAITGATAASYYGIPRTTADIDFLARIPFRSIPRFTAALQRAGLKADSAKIRRQLKTGYNVVSVPDRTSQYRADFIFENGRLKRRKGSLLGLEVFYQVPEQLILAKLRMIKSTLPPERSLKDKDDIAAILANTKVNVRTIRETAKRETTLEIFDVIRRTRVRDWDRMRRTPPELVRSKGRSAR